MWTSLKEKLCSATVCNMPCNIFRAATSETCNPPVPRQLGTRPGFWLKHERGKPPLYASLWLSTQLQTHRQAEGNRICISRVRSTVAAGIDTDSKTLAAISE